MAAESFVFEIAWNILGKLVILAFDAIGLIWGLKSKLIRIESTVSDIKAVLLDAVEDWLEKLQNVFYNIDKVLDDFITEE
ncbi:hypothetical protein LguiA_026358 [Lonicera macranthoides]